MPRYKKNYLNGSLFNKFNSNKSDKVNYLFNNIIDAHYDYLLTEPEAEFNAVCLSGLRTGQNNGSGPLQTDAKYITVNDNNHLAVKIRRTSVNGSILPDPRPQFTKNYKNEDFKIMMHEWAISDKPVLAGAPGVKPGQQLRCYYADGRSFGLPRKQLFFKVSETGGSFVDQFAVPFLLKIQEAAINLFNNNQEITTLGEIDTPTVGDSQVYSLSTYRDIARRVKRSILDNISRVESGNDPYICNYGSAAKGSPIGSFPQWSNLTFNQIRQIQGTGLGPDGTDYRKVNQQGVLRRPFAVGLYQIVNPSSANTMDFVLGVLPELGNLKFTPDNQAVAGAILLMNKRPVLGNYLLGKHDNVVEAGQNWAYEWAYAPSQYDTKRDEVSIPAGASYYSDVGGNKAGTTPQEIRRQLREGKEAMRGFSVSPDGFAESETTESAIPQTPTVSTSVPSPSTGVYTGFSPDALTSPSPSPSSSDNPALNFLLSVSNTGDTE